MFKTFLSLTALSAMTVPAVAQESAEKPGYNGVYVGVAVGYGFQSNDGGQSSILFDRDLNGTFGDTVTTAAGANAFSPGFCGGAATTSSPATGCTKDQDDFTYHGRIGADVQRGRFVYGALAEAGSSDLSDSVSAFSTTPASYTMTRRLLVSGSIRARAGYTPNDTTLFYATGGVAYGRVRSTFTTSNTANSFTTNGTQDAYGYTAGGGVEQQLTRHIAIGIEYLHTDLRDDKGRVRVGAGTAPATNPFLLAGAGGTDFRRSDDHFRYHGIRGTATFRF